MVSIHIRCILAADDVATCESWIMPNSRCRGGNPSRLIATPPIHGIHSAIAGTTQLSSAINPHESSAWSRGLAHRSSTKSLQMDFIWSDNIWDVVHVAGQRHHIMPPVKMCLPYYIENWTCYNSRKLSTTMSSLHKTWPRSTAHRRVEQQLVMVVMLLILDIVWLLISATSVNS